MKKLFTKLAFLVALSGSLEANAQLTGNKTVGSGGTYPTLTAAVADLNNQGVGAGGVTFNILGGHAETVANGNITPTPDVPAGLLIKKGGTASNPVVIKWDGNGAKPVFTAGNGIGNFDFVIGIAGQDYITIDGLKIVEDPGHGTNALRAEMGIALFKERFNTTLGNNGCQNVTIKNCEITLTRLPNYHLNVDNIHFNFQSTGIDLNHFTSTHQGSTSGSSWWVYANPSQGIKSAADVHSNIVVVGNKIDNCVFGVKVTDGFLVSGSNVFAGSGLVIGRSGEGNTITNFGPAAGVSYGGTYHATLAGISVGGQKNFSIEHNNISGATGGTVNDNLRVVAGIYAGMAAGGASSLPRTADGLFKINSNTISNIDLTTNATTSLKFAFGINFTANDDGVQRAKAAVASRSKTTIFLT